MIQGKVMHELIKLLFWGECCELRILSGTTNLSIQEPLNEENNVYGYSDEFILYGIDNTCGCISTEAISRFIEEDFLKEKSGYYVVNSKIKTSYQIMNFFIKKRFQNVQIYGVDPDYYFSLTPLWTSNRKNIEHYVSGLKQQVTIPDILKGYIKKLLIVFGMSHYLYERFIVIAKR